MKKFLLFLCAMSLVFGLAGLAAAVPITYSDEFPSADSTVVGSVGFINANEIGWFWSVSRGHSVTETFVGTGLEYAYQLDLDFQVTDNVLLENIYWDVYVNGSDIGDWSWTPVASTGLVSLSFGFSDITGNGTYEIAMLVSNEASSGYGSIALGVPGTMTLYGDSGIAPVPEPATMLLLGSGLVGLAAFGRKKLFKKS